MPRKKSKKSKKGKKSSTEQEENLSAAKKPHFVEDIDDIDDDEEIDEDEAFNSDDERKYGEFFGKRKYYDEDSDEESDDGSDNEDDDDGDDDDDEEEEEDDGGQYMLDLLNKLDNDNKDSSRQSNTNNNEASYMANLKDSEFSTSISNAGLTLDNLMDGLKDTKEFRSLQKTFQDPGQTTATPMAKIQAGRKERSIAYKEQSKDISAWTNVIQQNRQAETLDFRSKEKLGITRDTLVDTFVPKTDFEKELEQALVNAGQKQEADLLKAEEDALQDDLGANKLTIEEYRERRGKLAKIRALMFYHEQKRHQIKKIKSKKYRRIRKKQRERLKESAMEAAIQEDDDIAKELQEKEEVSRIQERMTLAHKNTSKWAKRVLKRGKNVDKDTRKALSAQLKRGDDLRRKMMTGEDDSDDENNKDGDDSDEDLVDTARKVLSDTQNDDLADPTNGKTGLFHLSFMKKGVEKQREKAKEEARKLLLELEANERDDYDEIVQQEEEELDANEGTAGTARKHVASTKEMKHVLQKGELRATALEFGNSSAIATSGGIEIDLPSQMQAVVDHQTISTTATATTTNEFVSLSSNSLKSFQKEEKEETNHSRSNKASKKRKNSDVEMSKPAAKDIPAASTVTTTARDDNNNDDEDSDNEEDNPWLVAAKPTKSTGETSTQHDHKSKKKKKKKIKLSSNVDIQGAADMLDTKKDQSSNSNKKIEKKDPAVTRQDDDEALSKSNQNNDKVKDITTMTQEELVRKAFATMSEKDIDEEFLQEKEKMIEENEANVSSSKKKKKGPNSNSMDDNSPFVSGWGSWTGKGTKARPPPLQKLSKKMQPPKKKKQVVKRKDEKKPNVIINEKRIKRTANQFMLGHIPFPFTSRAEYEEAMGGGVGREWNVTAAFKNMTRPQILTSAGKIIKPISKQVLPKRAPAKF